MRLAIIMDTRGLREQGVALGEGGGVCGALRV